MSYDEKIVLQCQANALKNNATLDSSTSSGGSIDSSSATSDASGSTNSSEETCSTTVAVGLYYNDVWEYDLNCTRCVHKRTYEISMLCVQATSAW